MTILDFTSFAHKPGIFYVEVHKYMDFQGEDNVEISGKYSGNHLSYRPVGGDRLVDVDLLISGFIALHAAAALFYCKSGFSPRVCG
ncbi:hypothetical protein R5M92_02990 [Halomonas sp. Bachu 37]|uniref:hypothetical protein n=1 Tax=Halomonas kashgarensis TaxID=3084920 RepID=UPI0032177A6D